MPEGRELEKQLKVAAKTGKYVVGRREVLSGIKGSKLLVWSASANVPQQILDECRSLSVPAVKFDGNPVELGRTCGIPFRVSVIAVKAAGDADLSSFSNASDYSSLGQMVMPSPAKEPELEQMKETEAAKKKSRKTTPKKEGAAPEKAKQKTTRKKKEKPVAETEEAEEPAEAKEEKSTKKKAGEKAEKPKKSTRKKKAAEIEDQDEEEEEEE